MFSDLKVLPDKQHPFLICRQDEHKTIILVFRATVSSKSLQDVFTDISFYSNLQVYEGSRHAGFSKRAESGPLLAVVNWLQQGWKVIVTGHSLGGAVSQLFTCAVIKSLTEIGLTPDKVVLRCVTFGIPQCADHDFWSSFSKWYDIFGERINSGRSVTKTLLFLTFYRAFASNFDRAFEKKIYRVSVSLLQDLRIDFNRAFVSILTGLSYRFY
jgi:hypothetical protein